MKVIEHAQYLYTLALSAIPVSPCACACVCVCVKGESGDSIGRVQIQENVGVDSSRWVNKLDTCLFATKI